MSDKVTLMNALHQAEQEVTMYREILKGCEERVREIRTQLDAGYTPDSANYSAHDVRSARQGVLQVLNQAKSVSQDWVTVWFIREELAEMDSALVERELRKLAKDHRSGVVWNGRRGPASRYGRR